jgi:hypothetical protein
MTPWKVVRKRKKKKKQHERAREVARSLQGRLVSPISFAISVRLLGPGGGDCEILDHEVDQCAARL